MDLSGIISIAGMPGLYKVVAQSKNGLIVESIADKKRFPAYNTQKISTLEDISIFTNADAAPLKDVFQKIYDKHKGAASIDHKTADNELVKYFAEILSDYDKEKVHLSDMRKVINWYNLLQKADLLNKKEEKKKEEDKKAGVAGTEEKAPKVKKAVTKNTGGNVKAVKNTNAPKRTASVRKTGTA